jgi:transposase-like protein
MTKQEQMFALVQDHAQSALTISSFCAAHNLKIHCFHYWRKKYRSIGAAPGFIDLSAAGADSVALRLSYPNGVSIDLPVADLALISRLIHLV